MISQKLQSRKPYFSLLADEIITEIFARLPADDIVALASTCKQLHQHALAGTARFKLAMSPRLLCDCLLLHLPGTLRQSKVCLLEQLKDSKPVASSGVSFLSKLRDCHQEFFGKAEDAQDSDTGQSARRILGRVGEGVSSIPLEYQIGQWQANGIPLGKDILALDLSHVQGLSMLSIRTCKRLRTLRLPPTLTSLDAQGCAELENITISRFTTSGDSAPGLPSICCINVCGCRHLKADWFIQMLSSTSTSLPLKYLDVTWCFGLSDKALATALKKCPSLETLILRGIAGRQTIGELAAGACPSLSSIDLAFSQDVMDADVEAMVSTCRALTRCNLRGCKRISSGTFNKVPRILLHRVSNEEGETQDVPFHYLKRSSIKASTHRLLALT